MEIRQIKYFIEVAKREHVTEAAHSLHVAQSAVSRQLFNLEEELGVALFIREGRKVKLTPIGRVFLDHMETAVNLFEEARQVIDEYTDPARGTIHIGFPSSIASYILPSAISRFQKAYPEVKFNLTQGAYYDLMTSVVKGDINMAILGPVPMDHPKITGSILFTENMAALLPRSHPLADRSSVMLSDLQHDSFVLYPQGYILRDMIENACLQSGFQPEVSFEGKDMEAIKGLVSAGLGVSMTPEVTLADNLPRKVVQLPIKEPDLKRTVGIVVPKERDLLPTEALFHSFVHKLFARLEKFQN